MDDTTRRDELALVRTHLANERTLLAYVRTALALMATGAALFQFFPDYPLLRGMAWLLLIGGVITFAIGVRRFVAVNKRFRGKS